MTTLQRQARALGDPTRYAIFRYLADADREVGVAELTEHLPPRRAPLGAARRAG